MRAECLSRYQFDRAPELFFQQKGKGHEVVERLFSRCKLDQKIDVARTIGLAPLERAKQAHALDAELAQIGSALAQLFD